MKYLTKLSTVYRKTRSTPIVTLFFVGFVLFMEGCTGYRSNDTLLQIGDYKVTVVDYEYMRNENTKRYKLSEADLEKRIIDEGYVNAYALDNKYDTIQLLKKKLEYAIRFYSAVSDGYIWNKTIKPLIKVTDADIKDAYDKKSLEYNIELIRIPDKNLLDKYISEGHQIKSSSDFNDIKSKVRSESRISFGSHYQLYPFIPSEIDAEKVIKSKPGNAWGPFEAEYGYLLIHISDIRKAYIPPLSQIRKDVEKELIHYRTQGYIFKSQKWVLQKTSPVMYDEVIGYMLSTCDVKARKWDGVDNRKLLMKYNLNGKVHQFSIADFIEYIENEPLYFGSLTETSGIKKLLINSVMDVYFYAEAKKMNMFNDLEFLIFKKNRQFKIFAQYYKESSMKQKIIVTEAEKQKFYQENIERFKIPSSVNVILYKFKDSQSALDCLMSIVVKCTKDPVPDQLRNQIKTVRIPEPIKTTLRLDNDLYPQNLEDEIMHLRPNQVSMPIQVNGEYWIVILQSKSELITIPYEKAKGEINIKMQEIIGNMIMGRRLNELKLKYRLIKNRIAEYLTSKERNI